MATPMENGAPMARFAEQESPRDAFGRALRYCRRNPSLVVGLVLVSLLAMGAALLALSEQRIARRAADVSQSLNLTTAARLALHENNTDLALEGCGFRTH